MPSPELGEDQTEKNLNVFSPEQGGKHSTLFSLPNREGSKAHGPLHSEVLSNILLIAREPNFFNREPCSGIRCAEVRRATAVRRFPEPIYFSFFVLAQYQFVLAN